MESMVSKIELTKEEKQKYFNAFNSPYFNIDNDIIDTKSNPFILKGNRGVWIEAMVFVSDAAVAFVYQQDPNLRSKNA